MIWDEEFETMPREALDSLQAYRLRKIAERVYATVPFYKEAFDKAKIHPSRIKSLEDLKRLPFTNKTDLRDNYPFKLFTLPLHEVVRIHASSGTTGKPTVVGYTKRDIDTWSALMARTLSCAGVQKGDVVQNAYGYGLFTGGLGFHYGSEKLGATVIPISGGNTKRQIMIMEDFGSTVLVCTPSYALTIAEVMDEMGVKKERLKLRVGIFGAEPWSRNMRQQVETKLGIQAVDIYGLSEVIGPGVSVECIEAKNGLHIFEDHFIPEVIDPDTGESLPYGEAGELVFTTLTKEAFPVIRYRTKDITRLFPEPCRCGRTHVRMDRVTGRTDDMLIIRGVNFFPSQIESLLMDIEGLEPHYQIIVRREGTLDTLEVRIEVNEAVFSDEIRKLESLEKKVTGECREMLGISAKIKLVEPKTLQRFEGKAKRVIDERNIQ
ncbi:MAG: phenylacetate--CoA ligase [Deltaproteobacteria bacterium]|nr:phenylacetate--CoA ligase [Deltaproteobacteria bacterium]